MFRERILWESESWRQASLTLYGEIRMLSNKSVLTVLTASSIPVGTCLTRFTTP